MKKTKKTTYTTDKDITTGETSQEISTKESNNRTKEKDESIKDTKKNLQDLFGLKPPTNPGVIMMSGGGGIGAMARRSKAPLPSYKGKNDPDTYLQEFNNVCTANQEAANPIKL